MVEADATDPDALARVRTAHLVSGQLMDLICAQPDTRVWKGDAIIASGEVSSLERFAGEG